MDELDLIQEVSRECGLSEYQTFEVINSLASNIQKKLQNQGSIAITGLGIFYSPDQSRKNDKIPTPQETIKYFVTHIPEWYQESGLTSPPRRRTELDSNSPSEI